MMEMGVSLASSDINGFKKWSKDHLPSSNDNDRPGGATPLAIKASPSKPAASGEAQHRPWIIPGVGGSF
jgi:hypothetical protein